MHSYEVEVKSLLGSPERAQEVREALKSADPSCKIISNNKQLNHYFVGSNLKELARAAAKHLPPDAANKLDDIASKAKDASVRTREKNGEVLLVVKASIDETSSENGIARLEFEEQVNMSLDELDKLVQNAGYAYQAKWSREREEYKCLGVNVTLDKNAGYGWLAEFERVVTDESEVSAAKAEITTLMAKLGVVELPQDRLGRMFAFYNEHWPEYYGTEKIFVVE
ncbi:CYTH domain-containing protein [Candidatus Kaiserbacteria bacterium]|nr:CYTH domain-containing protein [Candidatus Kaiserbacteria bacterium]